MIEHFEDFSLVTDGVEIHLDMDRINGNLDKAQYWLDNQVMTDMLPYMPMDTSAMQKLAQARSRALAGTGEVIAAAGPYGRYLYMGKVMVDSVTGKGPSKIFTGPNSYILRFRRGSKLVATERNLTFSRAGATARWFDTAKKTNLQAWINGVKARVGGG